MSWHHLNRFYRDSSGAIAVIAALSAPVFIGAAALGTEVGYAYMKHQALQSTAEMAAISAANAIMYGARDGKPDAISIAERLR